MGLHLVALFVLPKTSFGFVGLRPEDLTGVVLIGAVIGLALAGPLRAPRAGVWIVAALYFAYFAVVCVRDGLNGHAWSLVFWAKEASYLAFGYLIWRGYRSVPRAFTLLALLVVLPAIAVGVSQFALGARGIYGIAPLGHESSPASSGMVYFGCSLVLFLRMLSGSQARGLKIIFALTLILVAATGSKIAVLGAAVFYGTHGLLGAWQRRSAAMLLKLTGYGALGAIALIAATSLGWNGLAPAGLARYRGFLMPWDTLAKRGIWWKLHWIQGPVEAVFGAGYAVSHLPPGGFSFGMSMDNQVLYYLVTGGVVGLCAYVLLCAAVFRAEPLHTQAGRVLRALVVSYVFMGLGGEVLQLSVFGNVFWMVVGVCLTHPRWTPSPSHASSRA